MNINARGQIVSPPLKTTARKRQARFDCPSIAGVYRSSFRYTPAPFLLLLLDLAFRSRPRQRVIPRFLGPSTVDNRGHLRERFQAGARHRGRLSLEHIAQMPGAVSRPDFSISLPFLWLAFRRRPVWGRGPAFSGGRLRQKDKHGSDPVDRASLCPPVNRVAPVPSIPAGRLSGALQGARNSP